MATLPVSHPDLRDLTAFAEGRLPQEEAARVADHLQACRECQATLKQNRAGVRPASSYSRAAECEETLVQPTKWKPVGPCLVMALVPLSAFLLSGCSRPGTATELSPRKSSEPALVDCTGKAGVSAAQMRAAQEAWAAHLGRQVEEEDEIAPGVKMSFVLVPPGKFLMGSPKEEQAVFVDDEHEKEWVKGEVQHEVEITEAFYLGKYEVTQEQYEALTKENPSKFKGAKLPVEQVTWTQANAFAETVTKKAPAGLLYRLPREAEWEYACRGGRPSSHPFGIGEGRSLNSTQANFDGNYPFGGAAKGKRLETTCAVGSYQPNALGLFDMHGNVHEWCSDWYGDYPAGKATNPTGPGTGFSRVIRGGSWDQGAASCRAAARGDGPGFPADFLGFRLTRVPTTRKEGP
jgi:formylglycine-generating enzyme required for sulfatase activity